MKRYRITYDEWDGVWEQGRYAIVLDARGRPVYETGTWFPTLRARAWILRHGGRWW